MDLQQLRYVAALAQELHFLKAAKRINVSQPTLSQQLKKLEDELGSPLFERAPRNVRLTEAGRKFLPYALQVIDALEKGRRELERGGGELTGLIRLAAIPTICPYLVPEILERLAKRAPKVTVELFEETTSMVLSRLKEGSVDLGILSPPVHERGISELTLGKEKFYLGLSRKHPLAGRKSIRPVDLAKEKILILQEGHCFAEQSLEYCKTAVKNPQVIFRGSSLLSVMKLAAGGDGVTFVPAMARSVSPDKDLRFVPFSAPEPTREIGVAWRVSRRLSRAEELLIDLLSDVLKSSS